MTDQVTQRPWRLWQKNGFTEIRSYHEDGFVLVSEVGACADINTITLKKEDARHIVKCVNNHGRLVEALRDCSNELAEAIEGKYHGILGYPSTDRDYKTDMAVVEVARTLLSELEGDAK